MIFKQKIKPMLAKKAEKPFNSREWIYEIKWDGTRALLFYNGNIFRIQNRRLLEIAGRYPELKPDSGENFVIDGEIVVMWKGKPDFYKLQEREHSEGVRAELLSRLYPATFIAFDILYHNGKNLMKEPIERRKRELERADFGNRRIVVCEYVEERGMEFFERAVEMGLEGVMAKKLGTPYLPGKRVDFWLKFKKENEIDCVIVGYMMGEGEREGKIGSLLLALKGRRGWRYVGRVGTGFDEKMMEWLKGKIEKIRVEEPVVRNPPKLPREVVWAKPLLVCTVKFLEKTPDGSLRAPVFVRLRRDKEPEECVDFM